MTDNNRNSLRIKGIDWSVVLIYLALVFMGWINIYAAVYDDTHASIFDVSQRYGMQLIWMGVSFFIAISILFIDDKYWYILAHPLYWLGIASLVGMFFFGKEVNGANAWYEIGPVRIQPTEFVKVSVALVLARIMSGYSFSIHKTRSVLRVLGVIALPAAIIIAQNDTGSALVYGALFFMLYREGFTGWIYIAGFLSISIFLLSFYMEPTPLLILLLAVFVLTEAVLNRRWKNTFIYLAALSLGTLAIYFLSRLADSGVSFYHAVLISVGLSLIGVVVYAYRARLSNIFVIVLLFIGSVGFTNAVDYVFDNMMQVHQQKRILDLLGLESDLKGWGYNVNQSKIAIGSGGLTGKGFLQGTQTKYDFVPEQSTDFIFCTVGEEWGFIGCLVVVILFSVLILKLIAMGERQQEAFGRIYCYSVASIFLFHFLINVGMTIGIMPVIGIPLPFFSYGGSSLMAFTILLFIAVKLDSTKKEHLTRV